MTQVLEYLERADADGAFRCSRCEHVLGAADDYRELAAQYDESINAFEPASVNTTVDVFVMRHHLCPNCGVLFEVEMIAPGRDAA